VPTVVFVTGAPEIRGAVFVGVGVGVGVGVEVVVPTVMLNAGSAAESDPSDTRMTMLLYLPAAAGVPASLPLLALKDAQEGLLLMENLSALRCASFADGVKVYALPAMTVAGGVPLMVGAVFHQRHHDDAAFAVCAAVITKALAATRIVFCQYLLATSHSEVSYMTPVGGHPEECRYGKLTTASFQPATPLSADLLKDRQTGGFASPLRSGFALGESNLPGRGAMTQNVSVARQLLSTMRTTTSFRVSLAALQQHAATIYGP